MGPLKDTDDTAASTFNISRWFRRTLPQRWDSTTCGCQRSLAYPALKHHFFLLDDILYFQIGLLLSDSDLSGARVKGNQLAVHTPVPPAEEGLCKLIKEACLK